MVSKDASEKHILKAIHLNIPIVSILWVEQCGNTLENVNYEPYMIDTKIYLQERPLLHKKEWISEN